MEDNGAIREILIQCQRQYSTVNEIYQLTVQIGDMLAANDRVSVQMLLNMRQDELDKATLCKSRVALLEEAMSLEERQRFKRLIDNSDPGVEPENDDEKKILEIRRNIKNVVEKTIELDKRVNLKLAGKDSYYSKEKK